MSETVQLSTEKTEPETNESIKEPVIDIVGQRIDTKAMVYAPTNEMGVIFLAGFLWDRLGVSHIEQINGNSFPDAIGVGYNEEKDNRTYKRIRIEFEYVASNFKLHKHPIDQCDLIICWINDWDDCPIRIVSLIDRCKSSYEENAEKEVLIGKIGSAVFSLIGKYPNEWEQLVDKEIKRYDLWRRSK